MQDQTTPDVVTNPDTGAKETGMTGPDAKEAGPDVTLGQDAGDGGPKADADAGSPVDSGRGDADAGNAPDARDGGGGPDAADASDGSNASDASDASDAPTQMQIYAAQYGQAYCAGLLRCCPAFDAGGFDVNGCAKSNTTGGWDTTLPVNPAAYTRGHIALNVDAGAGCIAALQNFGCIGQTVTAAGMSAVLTACNGVMTGNIAVGSATPCVSSFECQNGYCNIPDGGSEGTCTALVASGGACSSVLGTLIPGPPADTKDQMCSQAGTVPGLFCDVVDADGGTAHCTAPLADNATCFDMVSGYFSDYGCSSRICGDNGCGTSTTAYPDPGFCGTWAPDAGGD